MPVSRSTDTLSSRPAAVTDADVRDWMLEHGAALWRQAMRKTPADVQDIWQLATLRRDALVQNGDRSVVEKRFVQGRPRFYKAYKDGYQNLQLIEKRALEALDQEGIRQDCRPHFAHLISTHAAKTRLSGDPASTEIVRQANPAVETEDAGPDLLRWQALYPTAALGQAAMPVPLFALPLFLAAVARQALLGLEVFHRHGVVHMDPWLANLCWQPDAAWLAKPTRPLTLDLLRLPLKWIDFELALTRGYTDLTPVPCSRWHAPQVHALAALQEQFESGGQADAQLRQQAQTAQQALDGRVDLWTFGYVLAQTARGANQWVTAMLQDSRAHFGADTPAAQSVRRALDSLPTGLSTLIQWAHSLQNLPQPLTPPDYRRLQHALDAACPALLGGSPGAAQLHVTLQPPGQRRWRWPSLPRLPRPSRAAVLVTAATLAVAGAVWQRAALAQALQNQLGPVAARWAVLGLPGLDEPGHNRLAAHLAPWAAPTQQAAEVHALRAAGGLVDIAMPADPPPLAAWARGRARALRGLWLLSDALEAGVPPSEELAHDAQRLLTVVYDQGNLLEQARPDQPAQRQPPDPAHLQRHLDALAAVQQRLNQPLAAWLGARWRACYQADSPERDQQVQRIAQQLAAWPAAQDPDGWYRQEGQRWLDRQRNGLPLCPIAQ